jgi:hypothetical protein
MSFRGRADCAAASTDPNPVSRTKARYFILNVASCRLSSDNHYLVRP